MNNSKVAIVVSQIIEKIQMIGGGLWAAFFILGFFAAVTDDSSEDGAAIGMVFLGFTAIGIWVFLKGRRRKRMRLTFKKYVAHLSVDPTGALENLAAATGTSVDVAKKNIQFMIDKKFFSNAYLDEANNQLVLSSMANKQNATPMADNSYTPNGQPQKEIVYKTCNCPNCGGINKVAQGTVAECDFCGSSIQV